MSTIERAPQQAPEQIPGQDTLFNADQYDVNKIAEQDAQAAEREAQGLAVLANVDPKAAGEKIRLTEPLTEDEAEATQAAYDLLWKTGDELPEELAVKRDWSDNEAEHNEKQQAHVAAIAEVLTTKLEAHEKISASHQKVAEKQQQIADQKAANEARDAKSAEVRATRDEYDAKRQALRDEYTAKQKLKMGSNQAELFSDEIARGADKYAISVLHPDRNTTNGSTVDARDLKSERWNQVPANQVKNQQTAEAVKAFHRGFADKAEEVTNIEVSQAVGEAQAAEATSDVINEIKTVPFGAETKEAMEQEPAIRRLMYKPNAEGYANLAVEFTQEGLNLELKDLIALDGKCVIITTEETDDYPETRFYAYQDVITNLNHMEKYQNDAGDWVISDEMEGQSQIAIGEPIVRNGKTASGPISQFLVGLPAEHIDKLDDSWEALDEVSPFKTAEDLIDRAEAAMEAAEASEDETEIMDLPAVAENYVLMQDRPKQIMSWAAKQLRRIKDAPLSLLIRTQRAAGSVVERFTDKEKGRKRIIAAVAGTLAVGVGVALSLKYGILDSSHANDARSSRPAGSNLNQYLASLPGHPNSAPSVSDLLPATPSGGGSSATEHAKHVARGAGINADHVKTVTVRGNSGDTLWNEAKEKLNRQGVANPTTGQIELGTLRLEGLNGITPEQAHLLASQGDQVIKV